MNEIKRESENSKLIIIAACATTAIASLCSAPHHSGNIHSISPYKHSSLGNYRLFTVTTPENKEESVLCYATQAQSSDLEKALIDADKISYPTNIRSGNVYVVSFKDVRLYNKYNE